MFQILLITTFLLKFHRILWGKILWRKGGRGREGGKFTVISLVSAFLVRVPIQIPPTPLYFTLYLLLPITPTHSSHMIVVYSFLSSFLPLLLDELAHKRLFNLLPQFSRLGTRGPASLSVCIVFCVLSGLRWGVKVSSSRILFKDAINLFFSSCIQFSQNDDLRVEMVKTRGTTLVEAAPRDTVWGIGLSAKNWKAQHRKHWRCS